MLGQVLLGPTYTDLIATWKQVSCSTYEYFSYYDNRGLCASHSGIWKRRGITEFILDFSTRWKCGHPHTLPALPPVLTE
jgi:hypothetical protein